MSNDCFFSKDIGDSFDGWLSEKELQKYINNVLVIPSNLIESMTKEYEKSVESISKSLKRISEVGFEEFIKERKSEQE
jgi:hypothetical protein